MNNKWGKIFFFLLFSTYLAACNNITFFLQPTPSSTPIPKAPTPSPTYTATLTPTPTNTSTPTFTPTSTITKTPTPEPVMIDDGRRWTKEEFFEMMLNLVGRAILTDPIYPHDDPFIDKLLPGTAPLRGDKSEKEQWAEKAYEFVESGQITPAYWCVWIFENVSKGYGTHVTDGQDVIQVVTIEEGMRRLKLFFGNKYREPYCPQFDE